MDVFELSTINFGLTLEGRRSAREYSADDFVPPYDEGIKVLQQEGATREDVAKLKSFNVNVLNDAHNAVHKMNGLGEYENFDWIKALKAAKRAYDLARGGKRILEKLERNEDADLLQFQSQIASMVSAESYGLSLGNTIDYSNYKPFKQSGWDVIDKILGGIPSDGPIVIYGLTGVGKSFCGAKFINSLLHFYREKTAAIYTLEMSAEHYMWRTCGMYKDMDDVLDRLYVSGSVRKVEELVSEVTSKRIDYVLLDDMDNMVKSKDAAEYERVYQVIKDVCRFNKIPFFVLGQPNRIAKLSGRFLGQYDVAWSGAAENSAALQIALQKANSLDMDDTQFATFDENKFYMIFWKSRDGWPLQQGPGAIILDECKDKMWGGNPVKGQWKLWNSGSGNKAIGRNKD